MPCLEEPEPLFDADVSQVVNLPMTTTHHGHVRPHIDIPRDLPHSRRRLTYARILHKPQSRVRQAARFKLILCRCYERSSHSRIQARQQNGGKEETLHTRYRSDQENENLYCILVSIQFIVLSVSSYFKQLPSHRRRRNSRKCHEARTHSRRGI